MAASTSSYSYQNSLGEYFPFWQSWVIFTFLIPVFQWNLKWGGNKCLLQDAIHTRLQTNLVGSCRELCPKQACTLIFVKKKKSLCLSTKREKRSEWLPKKPHYPLTKGEAIVSLFTLSLYKSASCDSLFQFFLKWREIDWFRLKLDCWVTLVPRSCDYFSFTDASGRGQGAKWLKEA